ncbi:MAG: RadC family protein [Bacillota bacterium]
MFLIKEIPNQERPRERMIKHGREALATHELIAIILRTGTKDTSVLDLSKTLYYRYNSIRELNKATVESLTQLKGMGKAKAVQLLAALELGKRLTEEKFAEQLSLTSPTNVYDYLKSDMDTHDQEMFYALYLNTKGKLIKKHLLFIGSLNSALVHPREVFKHAVSVSAAGIIIAHNHPSGDPTPSKNDIAITEVMVENGKLMDIEIIDHIIIGKEKYYSFKEHGDF